MISLLHRSIVSVVFGLSAIACAESSAPVCAVPSDQARCRSIAVAGVTREYLLHVPPTFNAGGSLVIALHGIGEDAARLMQITRLNATADAEGFAIAYPDALVSSIRGVAEWNIFFTGSFGNTPPDDIGFLRALITTLRSELGVDARRVYVVGLSNGGLMAHRVAIELGDVVAAVVDVAGTVASTPATSTLPAAVSGVSVLMLHGDADDNVPCCALKGPATMDDSFGYWAGARGDGCSAVSTTAPICEGPETPSSLAMKRATGCRGGAEVRFYMLFGGRHGWYQEALDVPGQEAYNPLFADSVGTTMNDIVWHWFSTHPKA